VGIPQKNTVPLLPAKAGDLKIEYIRWTTPAIRPSRSPKSRN
jgi:hypothetical protein